tara:strand:- start:222 stop:533 length:312 start_codon:yes stop_codon:yes gene_type:complete
MFKKTKEFNEIMQELKTTKLLSEVARFECFNDSTAVFSYTEDDIYHEFNVICDDTFFRDMKIFELLELERIAYFSHDIYDKPMNKLRRMGGNKWSSYDIIGLN